MLEVSLCLDLCTPFPLTLPLPFAFPLCLSPLPSSSPCRQTLPALNLPLHACARVLSADADSNSMWLGTDTGVVSQLTLTAKKARSRLVYSIKTVQNLQLAQVSSPTPGLVPSSATAADPISPFAAQQQRQLQTPFSDAPRQLTLSSSASSYRGSNSAIELVQNPLLQPPHALPPAGLPLEGRAPNSGATGEQMTDQPVPNQPLLSNQPLPGSATQRPLGPPPRHPLGRAFSAELIHGNPQQRPGSTPLLSRPPSLRRAESSSPADSTRQEAGVLMQRQSSLQRQGSIQSISSLRSAAGRGNSATAASSTSHSPVHAILILGGRVITSSGAEAECVLKEWSAGGGILTTHPCCELGECRFPNFLHHLCTHGKGSYMPVASCMTLFFGDHAMLLGNTNVDACGDV